MVSVEDILAARSAIGEWVHHTPVIGSGYLSERLKVRLLFKLESFQKTGSFKVRGALNKMKALSLEERKRGVISLSAGNHAQSLAYAATLMGVSSTLVMPTSAVRSKIEATRGYGGDVRLTEGDLLEMTLALQREQDLTLVHPFDDPLIIAGAGTVGLEILEDVPEVDAVVAGIGGGGLISGVAAAIKARRFKAKIYGVEPLGADAMSRSLAEGKPVYLDRVDTVADGLAAPFAGEHTLAHVQRLVDDVVLVTDEEIVEAMKLIMERCKVVVEPAAASTVAALLFGKVHVASGSTVVCILSGGNVGVDRLKELY